MTSSNQVYDVMNKEWKSTCRILLGGEIGELKDYEEWLQHYKTPMRMEKSSISGKQVNLLTSDYCQGAKFLSFDEVVTGKKFEPLNINQMKDVDSIVESLQERAGYTGNIILGNSKFVENCSNVIDSFYVYESIIVSNSKNIGFCDTVRGSENVFGFKGAANSGYTMKGCISTNNKRSFECYFTMGCSDCYYVAKLLNCRDCLFCFGAENKTHAIGNLELPRDKYLQIKTKLLDEIREALKKEKRIFSLLDVISGAATYGDKLTLEDKEKEKSFDKKVIEQAFSKTSSVILKKELENIDNYAAFLEKHVPKNIFLKSAVSGRQVGILSFASRVFSSYDVKNRIVSEDEIKQIGRISIDKNDVEKIDADQENLSKILSKIAYTTFDIREGNNVNVLKCVEQINAESCYNGSAFVHSKKCAYCFWPRESEYIFGSTNILESSFCMKSFYSKKVARAFEVDSCESCTDIYFSHNCENVHDSMFCFNEKNLRYAIGNAPLPVEKYRTTKAALLEQVAGELEKKKNIRWDIYNLGCGKV
ncbi:MAG: hypothetical protein V1492_06205 [Candidatus Micrarchaeota archaeon]